MLSFKKPSIEILLTTFQGEKNIAEQIDSIFAQTNKDFKLLVRDDGSDDSTMEIVRAYALEAPDKVVFVEDTSERLGASGSFSRLLKASCADYIMFCDQDDLWLPEKIELTLKKMRAIENDVGQDASVLVHTNAKVVNQNMNVFSDSLWRYQNIHPRNRERLNRLLVQNIATGCTVMINKPLRDLALPIPDAAIMHDWWLALVASAFGTIGHVDQSTMLYRQHHSNTVGAKNWNLSFVFKNFCGNGGEVRNGILNAQKQARAFLERYDCSLSEEQRSVVEGYASMEERHYWEKVYLLFKFRLFKAGLIRNIGLWAHI